MRESKGNKENKGKIKTESFRTTIETSQKISLLIKESGFSKTYIFERLICDERIVIIPQGKEIAKNLFLILKKLDEIPLNETEILERLDNLCILLNSALR